MRTRVGLLRRSRVAVAGVLSLGFLLFLPGSVEGLSEDEKPLPGIDELLDKVRGNLRSDRYLLRN